MNLEQLQREVFEIIRQPLAADDRMRERTLDGKSTQEIAEKIQSKIPFYLHFADVGKDEDQRNYEVSYEKLRKHGFNTTIDVDQGILIGQCLTHFYSLSNSRSLVLA